MSSTTSNSIPPVNRHARTAVEKQRGQLEKLLKDPSRPAYVPPPLKEKIIRPPREMMKNVQGSSAGAGSGEFHVYKASRRREYERLRVMEEATQKEAIEAEFERKRREMEEQAEAKTAKNRAKREKKKERAKAKGSVKDGSSGSVDGGTHNSETVPILKKRRLINGKELVFRQPGDESDDGEDLNDPPLGSPTAPTDAEGVMTEPRPVGEMPKITIHEE